MNACRATFAPAIVLTLLGCAAGPTVQLTDDDDANHQGGPVCRGADPVPGLGVEQLDARGMHEHSVFQLDAGHHDRSQS